MPPVSSAKRITAGAELLFPERVVVPRGEAPEQHAWLHDAEGVAELSESQVMRRIQHGMNEGPRCQNTSLVLIELTYSYESTWVYVPVPVHVRHFIRI